MRAMATSGQLVGFCLECDSDPGAFAGNVRTAVEPDQQVPGRDKELLRGLPANRPWVRKAQSALLSKTHHPAGSLATGTWQGHGAGHRAPAAQLAPRQHRRKLRRGPAAGCSSAGLL